MSIGCLLSFGINPRIVDYNSTRCGTPAHQIAESPPVHVPNGNAVILILVSSFWGSGQSGELGHRRAVGDFRFSFLSFSHEENKLAREMMISLRGVS